MKKSFAIVGILPLFLMACSQNMATKSPAVSLPNVSQLSQLAPSNSYIAVEPLAENKLKMTITAKDQDLYIANCSKAIAPELIEKGSEKIVWGGVSDACKSPDIVIKKGTSYGFIETINDKNSPLNLDKYYQVRILNLNDKLENPSSALSNAEKTSAVFKLLP